MRNLIFLCAMVVSGVICSQETRKETVTTDGVENNLTISMTGMYDGTTSEEADGYYDKAYDFSKSGDYVNAEKNYLKAIEIDSTFVEAYDNLGRVYRAMEKYEKAIEFYEKSIQLYPSGQMAHQNLAVVYGIQKEYPNALKEYEALLKIDANDPESYFGMANTYMMLGKFDHALTNATFALDIYKSTNSEHISDGYYLIGLIHYYNNNKPEAKENLILAKENGAKINSQIEAELKI